MRFDQIGLRPWSRETDFTMNQDEYKIQIDGEEISKPSPNREPLTPKILKGWKINSPLKFQYKGIYIYVG